MAARFTRAISNRLECITHPLIAYPYTVGFWCKPRVSDANTHIYWVMVDTSDSTQYNAICKSTGDLWALLASAGGAANQTTAGGITIDKWAYVVARFISATNRRISVLRPTGDVVQAQGTTSRAFPTSAETMALSTPVSNFADADIAEYFYTNTDIQPDAGVLQEPLRQLAYGGPFSVPYIAKDIIEYRSLRKHPTSDGDQIGEVYSGRSGRQTWTNTNAATTCEHPPLPYWFKRPDSAEISLLPRSWVAAVSTAMARARKLLRRSVRFFQRRF